MTDDKQRTWTGSRTQRDRARRLRHDLTDAERAIWHAVRAHCLLGAHFRRQAPIGPYVVDFLCHDAWLIIEIDGGQHFAPEQQQKDAERTAFLEQQGYRVLRFDNHQVVSNGAGVIETIAAFLANTLSPSTASTPSLPLPRKRGREKAAPRGTARFSSKSQA